MESQDLGKASQPAYRAGSPPYKQALRGLGTQDIENDFRPIANHRVFKEINFQKIFPNRRSWNSQTAVVFVVQTKKNIHLRLLGKSNRQDNWTAKLREMIFMTK